MSEYAELHCVSSFSFLRGASQPEELVAQADKLGYCAIAITDECSVAGVVRAHVAARELDVQLIIGSEFRLEEGIHLVLLATNRNGYGNLCELITQARRAAPKGQYQLYRADLAGGVADCLAIWLPGTQPVEAEGNWLRGVFGSRLSIGVELLAGSDDAARLATLQAVSLALNIPLVACGDVHMHVRGRRALQDTVSSIRLRSTVAAAVPWLFPNGERHLRPRETLARIYPPALLAATVHMAKQCSFSLEELRYEYPRELVPAGETPASHLRRLTEAGMQKRWPGGVSDKVRNMVEHELELIAELKYEQYFLTVHEIVEFARGRGILCQGRGSAANSAVCFCLGITEVDPARMSMLFERFISRERNEPPDIDVDFEHERREEVIQHIYEKYGRDRAALTATVISYRARSAIRDVGKALGLDALQVDRLARNLSWWEGEVQDERVREAGFDPASPVVHRVLTLARTVMGFPRHLSQHVGGFVISRGPLARLVPVENASMPDRTVIQWDKDDLDALGLLKVDVLGLGMLSAIRRSFEFIEGFYGRRLSLATVPAEDPVVYDMICKGDTTGVFQIESRAQMAMLPRLKPRCYYDLVIEVAIVRPGPIQGDMVHPYLRRRSGEEPVTFPSEAVRDVLSRTLGVPIFQEQVMQLAIVAAGFTPGEADQLRRAMAAWKRRGGLGPFEQRLKNGMRERGYTEQFADQIFRQIQGFGEYGFPESHSASFALLVYVSAWLKCHEPAVFACALINSQPMGFYAPSQLIQDAQRHGVKVRPADVLYSDRDCSLERGADGEPVIRLGLRLVKGFSAAGCERLVAARGAQAFADVQDLATRAQLDRGDLEAVAAAGALRTLTGNRHRARWDVAGVEAPLPLLPEIKIREGEPMLRRPTEGEDVVADYQSTGLTLGRHPMGFLRAQLDEKNISSAQRLWELPDGASVSTAGLVITRQRPGTAKGVTFVTLEDETGHVNLIVWERTAERQRRVLLGSRLLTVHGKLQKQGDVMHVVAHALADDSHLLGALPARSRNFR
ncbi:MAG: error-prone DNA polymerase [Gammaproteobacteria bacterium]|nr:error-prone DNA polymerase [Gammaproteobacteria bacterium]NNF62571.1 error-prone DNA polymerase [Gammaproteobacteria bacterium]NNM20726.1 error-prone DNA polymerase [Gammaproteobacteria bacterium]